MIDPVTLLAIGMLVVADALLAAALLSTSVRLQFRHLALAAIALSFELLRQVTSLVITAAESGTALSQFAYLFNGFFDFLVSVLLIGTVALIASGRFPWRLAGALGVVYIIIATPAWPIDFDPAIRWHWFYAFLPTIACHVVIVAQSVLLMRAGKPSGLTFFVLSMLMLLTRLGLGAFGGRDDPNLLYATTYFMDSIAVLAFGGALLIHAQQLLYLELLTARDAKETSDANLQFVLDNAEEAIISFDGDEHIVSWNERAAFYFGYSRDAVVGKVTLAELLEGEDRSRLMAGLPAASLAEGESVSYLDKVTMKRSDGSTFLAQVSARAILTLDGPYYTLVVRDVAVETELEQVRRNLQERAAHAQRLDSLSELAGGVAHEYNNLLTSIIGNAEMAMRTKRDEERRPFMEQIIESSNRATDLTAQILAYAGGGLHIPDKLCVADVIRSNEPLLSATVGQITSLSLEIADEPCWVLADESQLLHVIINLVSNAAESTPDQQLDVVVRCERRQMSLNEARTAYLGTDAGSGDYAYVEVRDNGEGMDKETVSRIFDPFFSTKFQGRGLGMATVFSIIKRHGGMIDIDSEPGKGTTVAIYLPLVQPNEDETSVA